MDDRHGYRRNWMKVSRKKRHYVQPTLTEKGRLEKIVAASPAVLQ
jgi:hypothetical protein